MSKYKVLHSEIVNDSLNLIINSGIRRNKLLLNFNKKTFIEWKANENIVCEMAAILFGF